MRGATVSKPTQPTKATKQAQSAKATKPVNRAGQKAGGQPGQTRRTLPISRWMSRQSLRTKLISVGLLGAVALVLITAGSWTDLTACADPPTRSPPPRTRRPGPNSTG